MAYHPNWKALSTVDFSWKQFVREGQSHVSKPSPTQAKYYSPKPALTGDQAKQIYDNVVELGERSNEGLDGAVVKHQMGRPTSIQSRPRPTCSLVVKHRPSREISSAEYQETNMHSNLGRPRSGDFLNLEVNQKLGPSVSLPNSPTARSRLAQIAHRPRPTSTGESEEKMSKRAGTQKTRPRRPIMPNISLINSMMKEAENNKVESITKYIEDGMDINVVDKFGWTLLMCAACAGAVDVVKLLIKYGADLYVRDKSGLSCRSLAKRHKHLNIVEMLNNSCHTTGKDRPNESTKNKSELDRAPAMEDFYCNDCSLSFCKTTKEQHMSSTVHLFNSRPRSLGTIYGIPESNKGYQLLLKRGWDKESGLGPDGTGHKFPCKTILKRDRKGLGGKQPKPRVTHFEPKEVAAVRHVYNNTHSSKKLRAKSINQEKLMERRLRNELS